MNDKLKLVNLQRIELITDILSWIDASVKSDEGGMIAVDTPTIEARKPEHFKLMWFS